MRNLHAHLFPVKLFLLCFFPLLSSPSSSLGSQYVDVLLGQELRDGTLAVRSCPSIMHYETVG